jgi:hypothetical protein
VQRNSGGGWLSWRWLLLGLFVLGYLATDSVLDGGTGYLVTTLAAIVSCAVLLTRLKRPLAITLPFWTILAVFLIGYYAKFYWVALDPDLLMGAGEVFALAYSPTALVRAFRLATIAFASFCLTAWVLLGFSSKQGAPDRIELDVVVYRSVSRFLVWIIPVLMISTFSVAYVTKIMIMGAESVYLPFRLAGFIFYGRTVFIPALILSLIYCSDKGGERVLSRIGIALLLLHGLSDALLRSSRGQLFMAILALGFLFLLSGKRLNRSALGVLAAGFLLVLALAPILTEYRYYRVLSPDATIAQALVGGLQGGFATHTSFRDLLASGFRFGLMRVTGMEMLLVYTGYGVVPLGSKLLDVMQSPRGVAGYVTVELLGIPEYVNNSAAVSSVGWFYLWGGAIGVAVGIFVFVVSVWVLWIGLRRLRLRILPVAQALVLVWLYSATSDGLLDAQVLPLVTTLASSVACEWLVRRFEHSRATARHMRVLRSGSGSP